ncbi:MAG: globin domain-containing protein [Acidimicrobiales bacterium]
MDGAAGLYDRLGGMAFFEGLVERFYERVAGDDVLRPLYPEDLGPPRRHLCLFLAQFWGGPRAYDEERGHPRLRSRHMQWRIGPLERERWLLHMTAALDASPANALERAQLLGHFQAVASHLVNADGESTAGEADRAERAGAARTEGPAARTDGASPTDRAEREGAARTEGPGARTATGNEPAG